MPFRPDCRPLLLAAALLAMTRGAAAEPVQVTVQPLDELWVPQAFSAPATVVARNAPALAAEIDARVVRIPVVVGDRVTAGQTVVELDCRRYEATLASAEANVASAVAAQGFARQQLARARDLSRQNSISEELLDQRRNEVAAADAALEAARQASRLAAIDVGHCAIAAPVEGVVSQRAVSVGDFAARGRVVIGLVETTGQEVQAQLRGDQVATIAQAPSVQFVSGERSYPVTLRAILPAADPVARTRETRLGFTGTPAIVGSAGRVTWSGGERLVPPGLLVRRQGALGVFVKDGDHARFVALVDAQEGRPAPSALAADSLLVVEGRQSLTDGVAIVARPAAVD
jgi:RND family efflux transporter MFP subunit